MGVTYVPWTNHLLISDSEVEEIPSLFTGDNLFETTLDGALLRTGTTIGWSNEPTGVAVNPATQQYLFSDDDGDQVVTVDDGPNNLVGDGDDVRTAFSTRGFNGTDIEGIAFAAGDIFLVNGVTTTVYRINDGANNVFEGGGDDVITSFNVGTWQTDPEGIEYDANRDTLSVISNIRRSPISEFDLNGNFLGNIDLTAIDIRHASGLTFGPSSGNASATSAYITDRAVDNDFDPSENDGKLYELAGFGGSTGNAAPVVTNPGTKSSYEGDTVSEQIGATDSDGPNAALSYSATGLPSGLGIDATTGLISGTVALGASVGSPYTVDVSVSDGLNTSHAVFPWNIFDLIPPATPAGFSSSSTTRALNLDWADNTEPDLVGYNVERAASAGGPYTLLTPTPIVVSQFSDPGATPGADNFYQITAVDRANNASTPLQETAHRISIVFRSMAKAHKRTGSSITVTKPAGTVTGDVLVASIAARGAAAISAPGWSVVKDQATLNGNMHVATLVRVADSADTSYTFQLGISTPSVAVISRYSGVNTTTPYGGSSGHDGSGSAIQADSVMPPAESAIVGSFGIAAAGTIAPDTSMIENGESKQVGRAKVTVEQSDQVVPGGVATGTRTATATRSAANAGVLIVLLPL